MPPRKRGSVAAAGKRGNAATGKRGNAAAKKRGKANVDDDEPPPKLQKEESFRTKLQNIIKEEVKNKSTTGKTFKPDAVLVSQCGNKVTIHEDYTCMLNQTNIGQNNNKFYVIQVVQNNKKYILFTKWGRVGEPGANNSDTFNSADAAINVFKKKFKDKTRNDWDERENFTPSKGKYTMLEMSQESDNEEDEADVVDSTVAKIPKKGIQSKLDARMQLVIKLIFNDDMFRDQMADMNLDVRKMPLGKLSKGQILKGLQVLLDIEKEIQGKCNNSALMELSSKFYTSIPHNFGRTVPPVINAQSVVDQKKDMMMTLTDIEIAQSLKKEEQSDEDIHPLDDQYKKLECDLERIKESSDEYKTILKYATVNANTRKGKLLDVWKVNRHSEGKRFAQHDDISYRKLLWHGTNVAVMAAILKSGLRIMPHSGGLVGRGIYFASEHAKSSWYVCPHNGTFEKETNVGFMFLVEVALGKMKFIKNPDGSLTRAPQGYDSIVARGQSEPDPSKDVKWKIEKHDVFVPVGKPVPQKEFNTSVFTQSEYLVYKESQARIRYILKFSFQ